MRSILQEPATAKPASSAMGRRTAREPSEAARTIVYGLTPLVETAQAAGLTSLAQLLLLAKLMAEQSASERSE